MTAHLNNNSRTLFKKAHQYTVQDSLSAHCSRQLIKAIIQEHCSRQLIQENNSTMVQSPSLLNTVSLLTWLQSKFNTKHL